MVIMNTLSFMLTGKGAFVREILIQELAKGLDALGLVTTSTVISRLPFAATFSSSIMSEEDVQNLETLRSLMLFLSGLQKGEGSSKESSLRNVSVADIQLVSIQELVPFFSAVSELPPESREQLLLVPADLIGRLVSRATARMIRRAFL